MHHYVKCLINMPPFGRTLIDARGSRHGLVRHPKVASPSRVCLKGDIRREASHRQGIEATLSESNIKLGSLIKELHRYDGARKTPAYWASSFIMPHKGGSHRHRPPSCSGDPSATSDASWAGSMAHRRDNRLEL